MDPSKVVHTKSDLDFIGGGSCNVLFPAVRYCTGTALDYYSVQSYLQYIQYILSTVKYSTHRTEHTRVRCPTSPPRETAISPSDDRTPHPCAGRDPAR
jgi:hypothetical protein